MQTDSKELITSVVDSVWKIFYLKFQTEVQTIVNETIAAAVDERVSHALENLGALALVNENLMELVEDAIDERIESHTGAYEHLDNRRLNIIVERAVENFNFDDHLDAALRDFDFDEKIKDYIENNVTLQVGS